MATKARINRVGYVGWRGITGCEVLDLDEDLTGLIGVGGAGKSTLVMCLNYAILPDRRIMDISPISDLHDSHSAGTDSLIGRINPKYGYAYVALDITTRHGGRLIAGIHIEPIDGRAHFNMWLIRNVPKDSLLQSLMCVNEGNESYYPDFQEMKRHLAVSGVDMTTCKNVGEYGQVLYEAGILPSSMVSMADRKLYAKLIETTFRGGISQEVATKLKDYLLPPQSQIQEIIQGLQDCTNEVLKTRNAAATSNKELVLLKSTYGVGKESVLTALRGIVDDISQEQTDLKSLQLLLANKNSTRKSIQTTIPSLNDEINVTEDSKNNLLAANIIELKRLSDEKEKLFTRLSERKKELSDAKEKLAQLQKGKSVWRLIEGHLNDQMNYESFQRWLESKLQHANSEIFSIEIKMKNLQEESERLSGDKASIASEYLSEVLGGQSLEQALGHITDKDAVAIEMSLGGLVEGVVGVDIDALANLQPSDDFPAMFWIGNEAPTTRPLRETEHWYLSATAGGCIVSSKSRYSAFGHEARRLRKEAITNEIEALVNQYTIQKQKANQIDANKTKLHENHELIKFYLNHRHDILNIEKHAETAQKVFIEYNELHKATADSHSSLQDKITTIQEPYNLKIKSLQKTLSEKQTELVGLNLETESIETNIKEKENRLVDYCYEFNQAQQILGSIFNRLLGEAKTIERIVKNATGIQAQRIASLCQTLGNEILHIESFSNVNAEDRLSVLRIWPDLMNIVRETVSIDLADMDGEDLIQEMQNQRASLDSDLMKHETELTIKARNIHLNISSSVRSQKSKIEKLSRVGQTIKFGNVTGIQIKPVPRSAMLEILAQFSEQLTLFAKDKPVDQILNEFFEAASSGGIKLDGEQLLDYRNYLDLIIEVKRDNGPWEPASSLCGTEVIGGGLAIVIMLTRAIAAKGESGGDGVKIDQIRPLFAIDEINRLHPGAQKLLVDFAKREHFQLIVTAPTLNPKFDCTLYALSRTTSPEERLIIRGARVRNIEESPAHE